VTTSIHPSARFDDARGATTSILSGYRGELRAERLTQVRDVLERAEAAALDGWWVAGFVTYECAPAFDPGLEVHERDPSWCPQLPLAWFGLYERCVTGPLRLPRGGQRPGGPRWDVGIAREEYALRVKAIHDEIEAGNAYQVNFTSSVLSRSPGEPGALYRQLVMAQQPAHAALIELDGVAIVSASPELFIDWDGTTLRSRPMKGTRRRGRWREEDDQREAELTGSAKDRAENVMIVDLIRNDMGKVARVGSVSVDELWSTEAYPYVWQMVSEVRCATRPHTRLVDVFDAMFPCGSVTGAPKQSAMGIIRSMESAARGVYCGAVGLLCPAAQGVHVRFNVAIRTAVLDSASGRARFGSGGGIVADSQPEAEYRELVLKAAMLNSSLGQPFRLLETFRFTPGEPNAHVGRHLARVRGSAGFLGFAVRADLDARLARRLARVEHDARVRLLISRDGRTEIQIADAPPASAGPVVLEIDDEPVPSQWPLLFHKSTCRGVYEHRRRRHSGADDVVMVNERGECTEVTTANLAVRRGSAWLTPPLACGCLPGVERARLIERGVLTEAVLTPDDLRTADELAVVNSLRGWRRAVLVDPAT